MKLNFKDIFVKPFISSLSMAIAAFLSYLFLMDIIGEKLATIVAILVGVVVYGIFLIITGTITEEDFNLLPKGDKIGKKLSKFKLLK